MKNLKSEVIKYAKMLNSKKLSALRSGNISARYKDGFLITPSGAKYSLLKSKDVVFVSLKGEFDKKKEYHPLNGGFIRIFIKIKQKLKQLCTHTLTTQLQSLLMEREYQHFIIW